MATAEIQSKPESSKELCPVQAEEVSKSDTVDTATILSGAEVHDVQEIAQDGTKELKPPDVVITEEAAPEQSPLPGEGVKVLEAPAPKRGGRRGASNNVSDKSKSRAKKESGGAKREMRTSEQGHDESSAGPNASGSISNPKHGRNKKNHQGTSASLTPTTAGDSRLAATGTVDVKIATLQSIGQKMQRAQDVVSGIHDGEQASAVLVSAIDEINRVLGVSGSRPIKSRNTTEAPSKAKDTSSPTVLSKKQTRGSPSPRNNRRNQGLPRSAPGQWKNTSRGVVPGQIGALVPLGTSGSYGRPRGAQTLVDQLPSVLQTEEHPMAAKIRDSFRRAKTTEDMENVIKQAKLYQLSYEVSLAMAFMRKKAETNR